MFTFSQSSGSSGVTQITISATSTMELNDIVENFTLSNTNKSMVFPVCQRRYEPVEKYIIFNPISISVDSSGGTASLNIQSNDNWVIVADDWIQLSRFSEPDRGPQTISGNGNTIVGIRFYENLGDARTGTISGYCTSNSSITATTTVSQAGSYVKPYLTLDKYIVDMPDSGMSGVTLIVNSNIDWITSTDSRWIDIDTTSGSSSGTIVFNVSQSDQSLERRGSIYVSGITEDIYAECVVAQSGVTAQTPYIIIVPTDQSVPTSGDSFVITVSSNTSWDVSIVASGSTGDSRTWITTNVLNGYGDDEVRVDVAPMNVEETGRTGYISFHNDRENLNAECNIEQTPPNTTKVFYTTTGGTVYTKINPTGWGANIISNTYVDGKGIIEFDGDVTNVPASAFTYEDNNFTYREKLSSVVFPESVETIGDNAFFECRNLSGELVIPDSVKTIGTSAFFFCSGLTSLSLGNGLTTIKNGAFSQCYGLTELVIPNSVILIDYSSFVGCSGLTGMLVIPNSVETISYDAFEYCYNITGLTIGTGVTWIGRGFIQETSITEIYAYPTTQPTMYAFVGEYIVNTQNGVLHYPNGSDYSNFISLLPSSWTAVADL